MLFYKKNPLNKSILLNRSQFAFVLWVIILCVGGGSSLKWCLPCRGNITAVVFPKRLELGVTSCAHSALTSLGIRLAYGSSLKSQKPCLDFNACLDFLSELAQKLLMWSWQDSSAFLCFHLVYISLF